MNLMKRIVSWEHSVWSLAAWLVVAAAALGGVRLAHKQATGHRGPLSKPIAEVQVGDRVLTANPTGDVDTRLGTVEPGTWRKIELSVPKRDGTTSSITLLRPLKWLEEEEAEVGGSAYISVPECGINGPAKVLRIDPCPPIRRGSGEVVTGTYRHHVPEILDLYVEGFTQPIGTTPNHRFWSPDRRAYVRADELRPGERLQGIRGETMVVRSERRPTPADVYNLEVLGVHTYRVTAGGWLVHNADPSSDQALVNEFRNYIDRFRNHILNGRLQQFFSNWTRLRLDPANTEVTSKSLGVAVLEVDGKGPVKVASVSGEFVDPTRPLPGVQNGDWYAARPAEPQLQTGPRGRGLSTPTEFDAEYKIFEKLMTLTEPTETGVVKVATDFGYACDSCRDAARQFSEKRPGIRVILIEANNASVPPRLTATILEFQGGIEVDKNGAPVPPEQRGVGRPVVLIPC